MEGVGVCRVEGRLCDVRELGGSEELKAGAEGRKTVRVGRLLASGVVKVGIPGGNEGVTLELECSEVFAFAVLLSGPVELGLVNDDLGGPPSRALSLAETDMVDGREEMSGEGEVAGWGEVMVEGDGARVAGVTGKGGGLGVRGANEGKDGTFVIVEGLEERGTCGGASVGGLAEAGLVWGASLEKRCPSSRRLV